MKLSNTELNYAKAARSHHSARDITNLLKENGFNASLDHKSSKLLIGITKIIELYSEDPTINLSEINTEDQYGIKVADIVSYLNNHLKEANFPRRIIENRKTLLGNNLKYYLDNPNNILRRLGYLGCFHPSRFGFKLFPLGIAENENLFSIISEATTLLELFPKLKNKKETLAKILSYRLGLPYEEIYNAFEIDISNKVKNKRILQHYNNPSVLGVCITLANAASNYAK